MGNFIWINFWIVLLYVCFPANSSPLWNLEESNVELMRTYVKCKEDSKFYTPIAENMKAECITAALECLAAELQTVRSECDDPEEVINHNEEFLEKLIKTRQEAAVSGKLTSEECHCESWPEKSFVKFLEEMELLLARALSTASRL